MHTGLFAPLLFSLFLLAIPSPGFSDSQAESPVIHLGDIPDRPPAPELPFKRFFEISKISDLEFEFEFEFEFAPNVRGSTGFGKAYSCLDNGNWGGGHIRDIVEVTESVRRLEFVDGNNMFIVGASFGGFSVMSVITQYPSVFKAAINVFVITELSTFVDSWPPYIARNGS